MENKIAKAALIILCSTLLPGVGFCLSDHDLIELRKGGIGDETISLLITEKTYETAVFTVPELISLKKAGIGESRIRELIRAHSESGKRAPIVYGKALKKQRTPTVDDIIMLKDAGVSDDVVKALIVHASTDEERQKQERAWQMLENMILEVKP